MKKICIGVIGLGYVGLPLSISLQKHFEVYAYDKDKSRISELKNNHDRNGQFSRRELKNCKKIKFFKDIISLKKCNTYIIAVPTPVGRKNKPNLILLKTATKDVSKILSQNDTIIYESTVYPGVTEDICVPIIEKISNLKLNNGFYCGYSPERINPGDKKNTIENIIKITSGSNVKTLNFVDKIYRKVSKVGTYKAKSIKIAEAAKVIENAQRDINIAFINEIKIIFDKLNLDIFEVLKASSTKWNFLNFSPGLVGGHCIGVDPYYLSYIAEKNNHNPKVILSGREINDKMSKYEAKRFLKNIKQPRSSKILVMGATFKEDCKDLRNSKAVELIKHLAKYNPNIYVYDPVANPKDLKKILKNNILNSTKGMKFEGIFLAVKHNYFIKMGMAKIKKLCNENGYIYDFKKIF